MAPTAAYDEIADWYEQEFIAGQRAGGRADADPLGIDRALGDLLGQGSGTCLDIGCGTGVHAGRVRALGWTPVGVDLSAGMLGHARGPPCLRAGRCRAAADPRRRRTRRHRGDGPHRHAGLPGGAG
jgi:SAM-dependent methyltransferase